MEEQNKHIDDIFREELGRSTELPPASVWDNLEKRLDSDLPTKPKMVWWMLLLFVSFIVGGSFAAYYFLTATNTIHKNKSESNNLVLSGKTDSYNLSALAKTKLEGNDINAEQDEFDSDHKSYFEDNSTKAVEQMNPTSLSHSSPTFFTKKDGNRKAAGDKGNLNEKPHIANVSIQNSKRSLSDKAKMILPKKTDNNEQFDSDESKLELVRGKKSTKNNKQIDSRVAQQKNTNNLEVDGQLNKNNVADKQLVGNQKEQEITDASESKATIGSLAEPNGVKKNSETQVASEKKSSTISNNNPLNKKIDKKLKEEPNQRGLSAFPADEEQELTKEDATAEDFTRDKDEESFEEKIKKMATLQAAAVASARSGNPLAASPMADSEIESISQNIVNPQAAGSGGGGASSPMADKKAKKERQQNMLIGLKMGYERGTNQFTAGKYVANVFVDIALGKKISFVMQPGFKWAAANKNINSGVLSSFINAGDVSVSKNTTYDTAGKPLYSNYFATQSYDSIGRSASFKKQYLEIEIPFLFKYKIDKNLSLLAGINFVFGKTPGFSVSEGKLSSGNISDSVKFVPDTTKPVFSRTFYNAGVNGKADLPASYANPISPVRFGYTLGLSYNYNERLMVDLIIQQNLSGVSSISNNEVRKLFDQPYVRLSLGYALFGSKQKK